jgi:hypothetical protein
MDIEILNELGQEHVFLDKLIFLYAIISIVIGSCIMRIADFVSFSYYIIQNKKNFHYWVQLSGLIMIFLMLLFYWFNIFDWPMEWKKHTSQSFGIYASSLIYPMLMYAAIVVLTPKLTYILNIRKHFFIYRKPFFLLLSLASFYLTFHDLVLLEQEFKMQKHFIRALGGGLLLIVAFLNEKNFKKHFVWVYIFIMTINIIYMFISKR